MASLRRKRRKACRGKAKHASYENAVIALRMTIKFGRDTEGLHVYKCPHCGYYHVGHRLGCHANRNEKWRLDRFDRRAFA